MSKTVIKGAQMLVDGAFIDAEVQLENGVITAIGQNLEGEVIAAEGYLLPGLIDEHIHGIYGIFRIEKGVLHRSFGRYCAA